jgi:IS30 family transposase
MKNVTRKMLTSKEFNNIKVLQGAGISISQASSVTGRSNATISRIFSNDTYELYKAHIKEANAKTKASREAKQTAEVVLDVEGERVPVKQEDELVKLLQNIDESLKDIDRRLHTIENSTVFRSSATTRRWVF